MILILCGFSLLIGSVQARSSELCWSVRFGNSSFFSCLGSRSGPSQKFWFAFWNHRFVLFITVLSLSPFVFLIYSIWFTVSGKLCFTCLLLRSFFILFGSWTATELKFCVNIALCFGVLCGYWWNSVIDRWGYLCYWVNGVQWGISDWRTEGDVENC